MWKYLRFGLFNWIATSGTAVSFVAGGIWMWFGVALMFIVGAGGELFSRDDIGESNYRYDWIHD